LSFISNLKTFSLQKGREERKERKRRKKGKGKVTEERGRELY
jgi:hypothetical protein